MPLKIKEGKLIIKIPTTDKNLERRLRQAVITSMTAFAKKDEKTKADEEAIHWLGILGENLEKKLE